MPSLIIKDFKIGLDRRRMNETSLPGSLVICENVHITRGGEIEKSEAFLRFANLPANTFGLQAVGSGFFVFGSDDITPKIINSNPLVRYQRLNPEGGVKSWGSFTVADTVEGDTATSVKVDGTELLSAEPTKPWASFEISGAAISDTITDIIIDGNDITASNTTATDPVSDWPSQIAQKINDNTGNSGFSAFASGDRIIIEREDEEIANIGDALTVNTTGSVTIQNETVLAETSYVLATATVDNFPGDVADKINEDTETHGFAAYAEDGVVFLYSDTIGTANNGDAVTHVFNGDVTISSVVDFANGEAATNPDMVEVLSVDLFDGKPYVIAEYDDGIIRHWYDGELVGDMFSGKARVKMVLSAIAADAAAVASSGSFTVIDPGAGSSISSITVGAVELLASTINYDDTTEDENFLSNVIDAINENSNESGFSAELFAGRKFVITAQIPGDSYNGDAVAVVSSGTITVTAEVAMAGGVAAKQITDIDVDGTNILTASIDWAESNPQTAAALASAINENSETSGYQAAAFGSSIIISSTDNGTEFNNLTFAVTAEAGITVTAGSELAGGSVVKTIVNPGRFSKTYKNKMYVLTGPSIYYSAIDVPNDFDGGIGFGFDNLATNSSGSENLIALANYFDNMAIFGTDNIQIWFMSDDPDENQQLQVLNNTSTVSPGSVVEFGDNDVFYIARSGIRSLRARDSTNAAFVNDVGIAIDNIIQEELLNNNVAVEKSKGILEPRQGRLLEAIGDTFYVFSFFPSSKISAWSTYKPGFEVQEVQAAGQTIVCRSDNALYKIGSSNERVYDSRKAEVVTPFLSGDDPSLIKQWVGMDMACQGTWEIYIATDISQTDDDGFPLSESFEKIGTVTNSTYNEESSENGDIELDQQSSHIALKLVNKTPGYGRIGNVAIHFADGGSKG